MPLPHRSPMSSYWLSSHAYPPETDLSTHRTTPELPAEVDVAIIGSGFSGAAMAYYILKGEEQSSSSASSPSSGSGINSSSGGRVSTPTTPSPPPPPPPPQRVVIVEAREACSGATGRNGGHVKPDLYFNAALYSKHYGPRMAAELTEFETRQVFDIKKLVEQERIECDFELTRTIDVYTDERVAGPVVEAYMRMKESEGYEFAQDLHFIPGERGRAEQVSGVKGALCAFSYTAASLWPWKLVMGLLGRVVGMGGNLQTNTVVLGVEREGEGDGAGRWVLRTERGEVRAKTVVVTTNAYTGQLLNEFEGKITPARGVACRIATSTSGKHDGDGDGDGEDVGAVEGVGDGKDVGVRLVRPPPHLNNTYSIRFGPQEYDYLISRTDGSIVVGGAKQAVLLDDSYWRDNTDDSQLIPGAREYFTGYMQRHFHGWEGTDAQITHIWTGIMGYSADLMPWVGEVPNRKGVFVSAGFTGHGMPRILGCAEAVAGLVRDRMRGHGQGKDGMQGMQGTKVPRPYWVTKERLEEERDISREYMAGGRAKEGTNTTKL
ncbi:hypothetical protein LTR47_002339 [Exophiala xenobiotica]|nr:hypothetical protein LTR47_002339 [Exophiala xenobiotica]